MNQFASVEIVFWAALGILFYAYVGYPVLLTVVAPFYRRIKREPGYCPSISVVIPAYNEAAYIGRKLKNTLALEYPPDKLQILVISDSSTDRTDAIVQGCADPRVTLLRTNGRVGKTQAQNNAVTHCTGEIVVFSDATAMYDAKALLYLACNYEDANVGAVSGRYEYADLQGQSPTGLGSITFWSYENLIKGLQSRISTLTGCSGCIYSVRRSVYTPLPPTSCSDLVEPLWVVKRGYRVVFEERSLAYEETTKSTKEEFWMRVRVAAHGIMGIFTVAELLNFRRHGWIALQIVSHKLLRWLVPVLLILLFVSTVILKGAPVYRSVLFLQIGFYSLGLLSVAIPLHRRWKPLGIPLYFCTLNLAVLVSIIQVLRGKRYAVWNPVRLKSGREL